MKRMTRRLLAIVASSAVALPMVAQVQADEMKVEPHSHPATYEHEHEMADGSMSPLHAHEHESHPHSELHSHGFTLYGSVRSGIYMLDPQTAGADTSWDIGSADAGDLGQGDQLWSRIGVRASHALGGGMSAGLHVEKRLDNFRTRHQNVWIGGDFGRLTFGQQGSAYYSATTWDGSNLFGDWQRAGQISSRVSGIKYSSNLGGPFNFEAMLLDSATGITETEKAKTVSVDAVTVTLPAEKSGHSDGVNATQIAGTFSTDAITLSTGYVSVSEGGMDFFGGSASGAMGGLDWDVGFELGEAEGDADDVERYGFTVGYTVGNSRAYVFYEHAEVDDEDLAYTLFGLSHTLAPGVVVIAEYQTPDEDASPNRGAVAIRVDF